MSEPETCKELHGTVTVACPEESNQVTKRRTGNLLSEDVENSFVDFRLVMDGPETNEEENQDHILRPGSDLQIETRYDQFTLFFHQNGSENHELVIDVYMRDGKLVAEVDCGNQPSKCKVLVSGAGEVSTRQPPVRGVRK